MKQLGQHDDDETIVNEITDNIARAKQHFAKWRVQAKEDYDFYAGEQWSESDKAKLNNQNRVAVTFNRIARTINAVAGLELQNRQEARFITRRKEDTGFNDMLNASVKWVRDNCDAEDEESEAFQDALICGMGWTETRMDYEMEEDGKEIIERIDPLEMGADPFAKKRNYVDGRFCFREKKITRSEFDSLWPDADIEPNLSAVWQDNDSDEPHDAVEAKFYRSGQSDTTAQSDYVTVIQYQYWKRETYYRILSEQGNIVKMDEAKFQKLQKYIEGRFKYVRATVRKYYQAFVCGKKLLENKPVDCDAFTFQCITGLRDRNRSHWFGMVQLMKDPQRWANKWLSQIQHIINTNAKGGLMAERGAIANMTKFKEDWAKPDGVVELNEGGLQKIQTKDASRYPEGLDRLMNYALSSINDVPGVNLEMIGMANRDQPAVLEQQRKQAGITILATFFNSLRNYRKNQGRITVEYIKNYIADGRLIPVIGKEGEQYLPLLRQDIDLDYRVVVADAPNNPDMKERVFAILNQMIPVALQAGIPIPPEILDYSPLPDDLVQKWKKTIEEKSNNPMAQQMQQLQTQLAQLENEFKKSQTVLNYAKAEQAKGQDDSQMMQQQAMHDAMLSEQIATREQQRKDMQSQHDMQLKQGQTQSDIERKNREMLMTQYRKGQEARAAIEIKKQQAKAVH